MKRIIYTLLSLCLILVFSLPLSQNVYAQAAKSSFWVEYIDVGQGDAALIQCNGHYMLIDGGPPSASSTIYSILKNKNIDSLDYIIATHSDADHIGGLSGALNYSRVGTVYSPVTSHDAKNFNSLVKYVAKQGKSLTIPELGEKISLGSASVQFVGPRSLGKSLDSSESANNNSIVTRITYGSTSFLFMGDAETEEENELLTDKVNLKSEVIKVAHHGSGGSSSTLFLNKVRPKYAIISVGADNTYGHPTEETMLPTMIFFTLQNQKFPMEYPMF